MLALALAFAPAAPAGAQDAPAPARAEAQTALEARADQVVDLINARIEPGEIFTEGFRAAVADEQIKTLSASFTAQFGRAVDVALLNPREGTRAALEIRFERGLAKGGIAIAPAEGNRINELRFTAIDAVAVEGDTPEAIAADLAALPGQKNAWFGPLDEGTPLIRYNPEWPLALGSTFKLYILAALAEDVKAGRRKWSDVVPLTEKSYPSGQMQDWPKGAPVTLHTLASLMISISDNTATDQLIATLGRKRILKAMADSGHANPAANDPFLTTREMFAIKAGGAARIEAWRSGERPVRAALLDALAATTPTLDEVAAAFGGGPKAIDIEWFASPKDLARLMLHLRRTGDPKVFEIMAINPSASQAVRANWAYIGFKGGSEPGVLNYTWLLTDKQGRDWALTLGWNNPAAVIDRAPLDAIAQRILLLQR